MTEAQAYQTLMARERERSVLGSLDAVVAWDESTYMPPGGVGLRGEQKALLAKLSHQAFVAPEIAECLAKLDGATLGGDEIALANVREIRRSHERATKLPSSFYEELARVGTSGRENWIEARRTSDYAKFAPYLKQLLKLRREEASMLGFAEPYDSMLDLYEPGSRVAWLDGILGTLKRELLPLVDKICGSGRDLAPSKSAISGNFPIADQAEFGRHVVTRLGFDFKRGRLDTTTHPFCSGFSPDDVRITTRYELTEFSPAFFAMVHEAGHGLYEQGLPAEAFGSPVGRACSMAMHESQSRLWENFVARSDAFWEYFYPKAQSTFASLKEVPLANFLRAVRTVKPSTIRVEADEVTYNLHIVLRFELEREMLSGRLTVEEVPAAWNAKFKELFGFLPPSDAQGCLQDVHWSGGDFGYFPTYALGNCYAAQLAEKAEQELGDLSTQFRQGQFAPLREWLAKQIYRHGQRYPARELCERVTGQAITPAALLRHLKQRYLV
jgi:carboxypeptidase Taq